MTTEVETPRAWTADEIRDMLIEKFREIADYWAETDLKRPEFGNMTPQEDIAYRCHGVAFTMLSTLDGCSMDLPGFDLIPTPHPSDKQYCIDEEENWFDPEMRISTTLHEYFSALKD